MIKKGMDTLFPVCKLVWKEVIFCEGRKWFLIQEPVWRWKWQVLKGDVEYRGGLTDKTDVGDKE